MGKGKLKPKDLRFLKTHTVAQIDAICAHANDLIHSRKTTRIAIIDFLQEWLPNDGTVEVPEQFQNLIKILDSPLQAKASEIEPTGIPVLREPLPYRVYGAENIEPGAIEQMENAMSLPISVAGALMADAHEGYGLPIGGVLATTANVVIPYAVGVDIACRMCMSVFQLTPEVIKTRTEYLRQTLLMTTIFGVGGKNRNHIDSSLFDRKEWSATSVIRKFRDLAFSQLGTSGGGNHFVQWGELHVLEYDELLKLLPGRYLAVLSHSGSRGFGSEIALHYSKLAMSKIKLPGRAKHLAWLDLDTDEGQEYWLAMNLAGEYASANHREIHEKISRELKEQPIIRVENHHNFAWRETLPDGRRAIVHRKGATPAHTGSLGIISGTMVHAAYVVRGKAKPESLNSASHGAGRRMSRHKALQSFSLADLRYILDRYGVELIGGGLDEFPMAYKDIDEVMQYQSELVEVLAKFYPRIVRMAEPEKRHRWE